MYEVLDECSRTVGQVQVQAGRESAGRRDADRRQVLVEHGRTDGQHVRLIEGT